MEFDALLNTLCWTSFVLFGLWIIAHAVQVVELHVMARAYAHHKAHVFAIPFVPLLTRLFHEMALPQFLASEAIQRGELPPVMRTHSHRTPAAVPVEYVDANGVSSLSTLTNFHAVGSASLPPPSPSTLSTVLNKSPANTPTDSLRSRAGKTKEEGKRKWGGVGVDRKKAQHQEERRQQGPVAVPILDPNLAAAGDWELTSSPNPAWWTPQLEGQCLVFGLHLPLELLPASRSAPQASAFANAEARGVGGNSGTGNWPGSSSGATTRQPTVNLQLKQYQLTQASLVASEAAPSPALHHHTALFNSTELGTQVAVAKQLSVAPVRVYTRATLPHARINTSVVPSPRQCYSSPAASSPGRCAWPGALPLARTPSQHLDFDSIKYAYIQYYQGLLKTAVAEQSAIAHRARKNRRSSKSARHIAAMLMHYLQYAHIDDDGEDDVKDGDAEGRAGGGGGNGSGVDTSRAASSKRRPAATLRAAAGHGSASVFPSRSKHGRRARSGKSSGGVGVSTADCPQCNCGPWIPVLGGSASHHSDAYDAVGRDGDLVSSALSSRSLYRTAAPLPPSQLLLVQQSSLKSHSSPSLMQPSQTAVVPPPLSPARELRRGINKRRRRAEAPSIADSAVEALEGLVERVRLAQTLRPRYQSLFCTVRFAAERFIVRRGANEPPTWTPLKAIAAAGVAGGGPSSSATDGRGAAKPKMRRSSSSSSISPQRLHLHRRYDSTDSDSRSSSSSHSHRSDSPPPALPLLKSIIPAPANVSAELAIPSSNAGSSGSTSAANAAIQFLRASRLRENNIRAAIAAGAGNSAVGPFALSSTLDPSLATSLSSSSFYSTVAAPAETRAPREVGSPHRYAVEVNFSMSAEGAPPLSRDVTATGAEPMSLLVDKGDASGKEVQPIGAAVAAAGAEHAQMDEAMPQQKPSQAKDTASRLLEQRRHPQPVSSSREEAPQRAAASATSPSLQPRSTDLRIVYVIGADRATLLRSLTLDATRSFAAGTRNFLCFFTRKDERRAQRRYMEQLDRQNRAALQLLAHHETPADASRPREQRDRMNTAIGHVHTSSAVPLHNRAEETLLSAGATAALRSVPGPPWHVRAASWHDVNLSMAGSLMSGPGSVDGGFGDAGTVNQQPRDTRLSKTAFFKVAGADLLTLAVTPVDSAAATVTAPSAHQCDDSFLSMMQSLETSFRSAGEPSHAAPPGTAEVATASAAPDSRSSCASVFATIQSLSTAQLTPTTPAPPAPLAACGEEVARGATAAARSCATPPNTATADAAAEDHTHVDVAPPTVSAATSPAPAASTASNEGSKASEKRAPAATAKIDTEAAATDSVSAHDVRQYLATAGVTLPQQVYLLRDADALTPLQQLQRTLARSSHHASVLTARRDSSARTTGTDTPTAAVPSTVGGTAAHHRALLSTSVAAVLSRGATRVLEGQVDVAGLSLDVLSRQISPFVPMEPPPLSDSDGDDGAESSMSGRGSDGSSGPGETSESDPRSSEASHDDGGKVVVRENAVGARRSSPLHRRGKRPQKSKTAAAANRHGGHSSKNCRLAQRSGKASPPQQAHSRRRHQQHSRSSRGHGRSSARSSLKHRRRQYERRRKRHLARWNRHIQHQRAAANKAGYIPVAAGVLFFTAPPTLPAALVRQQRQLLLDELESGERGRRLVPDWALNGSEAAAPVTVADGDARQDGQLASSPSPHDGRSPSRRICVTLIYTATAEQVAQALVRAAEVAAEALKKQRPACDAVDGRGHRNVEAVNRLGRRRSAVAAWSRKHMRSGRDTHEFLSSNPDKGLRLSRPSQQRHEAAFMDDNWHGRRSVSLARTQAPSKNSLCYSFTSEKLMPQLSQAAFSTVASEAFVGSENLLNNSPVVVPPANRWCILSPNVCSETATFSAKSMEDTDFSGRHGSKDDGSTAALAAAAASPLMSIHDRPPPLLLLTESSDSVFDYGEGRSSSGGSATAVGGRWDSFGRDAASDGSGTGTSYDGFRCTGTSVYVEELEWSTSSARGSPAHFADSGGVDDDVERARSASASAGGVHAAKPPSKNVRFKGTEAERGEEDKVGVAHELMNVLRDSTCFPDGVPVGVSLAYARIGNDLYAITEVVDRTFLQYREERVIQSRKEGGGCSTGDGDDDSLTSLSDSAEDAQTDGSYSYSSMSNSSFTLGTSFKTLDAALEATQEQHTAAVQQQYRRLHRRRAVSTSNFGGLSYSLAGSAPLRPGMRRQEVHMCWRCLSAEAAVIFVPCGHYAVCEACAEVLADCCLCRTPILSSVVLLVHNSSQQA
ncbi:conserved hypothetical protein [Leishmania mexicana MHOM/GT/2001/U1103]|uniref:Zinc finger, C3HC4 type (RING finger) family protein n=1 Tax=Leishmania mexicana (strain MHOM/GT/2001/U1103) TaxID=929439 RepID=E9AVU2_LEIMU|nr:conserved hypothetical protein [Leishmania mexicana MHOM/GT/2001/U1103]CBZ27075.1 conserved hypothetical protein [Leishmania mexicana MHOM/GT/2001/U1103]